VSQKGTEKVLKQGQPDWISCIWE